MRTYKLPKAASHVVADTHYFYALSRTGFAVVRLGDGQTKFVHWNRYSSFDSRNAFRSAGWNDTHVALTVQSVPSIKTIFLRIPRHTDRFGSVLKKSIRPIFVLADGDGPTPMTSQYKDDPRIIPLMSQLLDCTRTRKLLDQFNCHLRKDEHGGQTVEVTPDRTAVVTRTGTYSFQESRVNDVCIAPDGLSALALHCNLTVTAFDLD